MKKIILYTISIFCIFVISIFSVYAYSTDIYDIDIPDGFYKAENNDYWQKEGEDSSLSILIYTEKNKNNLDLSSYSEDDIDEEEYINALKRGGHSFNTLASLIAQAANNEIVDKRNEYLHSANKYPTRQEQEKICDKILEFMQTVVNLA